MRGRFGEVLEFRGWPRPVRSRCCCRVEGEYDPGTGSGGEWVKVNSYIED